MRSRLLLASRQINCYGESSRFVGIEPPKPHFDPGCAGSARLFHLISLVRLDFPQCDLCASAHFCRTVQALLLQTFQTNPGNVLLDVYIHLRFHQGVLWLGGIPSGWTFYRSDEF